MSIRVAINHKTHYTYDRAVSLSPHVFRLRPAPHCRTPIEAYSLRIRPETHFINWQQDPFGNYQARVVFPEKGSELYIEVDVVADMTVINPFEFFVESYAENFPFTYDPQLARELVPYLEVQEAGPLLTAWLAEVKRDEMPIIDFLVALNHRLYSDIAYSIRMEPGVQSCEETLERALGSCRDSGWLLVQILRHLGLAARFASGYLVQLTADVPALDGPSGPSADFTDLHAWAEVYLPGAGWVGLDPTSGLFAGEGHIPLACTPHPVSAAPVTGATDKCEVTFAFDNSVRRLREDPRVTKPYTDEQWATINSLGEQVDGELIAQDVRLTMGGEPTFVSIDDREAPEWNTEADGPHKRKLANQLLRRLQDAFGAGGILQYGQGKWYPGEPLPRWKLAAYWRTDGIALWRNPNLLADISHNDRVTVEQAQRFTETLAAYLQLSPTTVSPAYEDVFYYLLQEGRIPDNLDPLAADLADPLERRRLANLLERGLDTPKGFVLPLGWDYTNQAWRNAPWTFRRGHLYLMPGDSAMGLRLPLDSLPWVAEEDEEAIFERSAFEELPALPDYYATVQARYDDEAARPPASPKQAIRQVPHTALCVEPREGRLHVFMPPTSYLEHYLDLLAAVELSAQSLDIPGVIEVNIHPSHSVTVQTPP